MDQGDAGCLSQVGVLTRACLGASEEHSAGLSWWLRGKEPTLRMQETREDPRRRGATQPGHHNR